MQINNFFVYGYVFYLYIYCNIYADFIYNTICTYLIYIILFIFQRSQQSKLIASMPLSSTVPTLAAAPPASMRPWRWAPP